MAAPQRPGATSTIRGHGKPHLAVSDGPRGRDSILSPFDRRLLRTRKLPDVVSPLKEIQLSVQWEPKSVGPPCAPTIPFLDTPLTQHPSSILQFPDRFFILSTSFFCSLLL